MWKWQKNRHPFVMHRRPWAAGSLVDQNGSGAGHPTAEETNTDNEAPLPPPDVSDADPPPPPEPPPPTPIPDLTYDTPLFPLWAAISQSTRSSSTGLLNGGAMWCPRRCEFNRIQIETTAATGGPSFTICLYQFEGGELNDGTNSVPKLLEVLNEAASIGIQTISVPTTEVETGYVYVLVGRYTGAGTAWSYRCHDNTANIVWHNPPGATSNVFQQASPVTPPGALNLSGVSPSTNANPPHIRLFKV